MSLEEVINKDYIQAMKDRNSVRSAAINYLRAMIKQVKVDKRLEKVEDAEVISIIKKQVKQRLDSIDQFEKGGRADLADKEKVEMDIMKVYLPAEMSTEEVEAIVEAAMKEVAASSMKDMGAVMKLAQDKIAGRADGKMVSALVKERLASL